MLRVKVRIVRVAAGFGFLLFAAGCRSRSAPEATADRVETSAASITSSGGGATGRLTTESVTLDAGAETDTGPSCAAAGDPTLGVDAGSSCGGSLAQATFTYGLCACTTIQASNALTTDGFDSTRGPPDGGLGGNVGANNGVSLSTTSSIGGNLWTPGNVTSSNPSVVRGDLHLGGTLGGGATFTVDGNAFDVNTLPGNAKVLGEVSRVSSVAAPCDCSNLVPVASITAAHRTTNDDGTIGLSPTVAVGNNPARIDLPCGNYYFSQINAAQPLTIAVHGHTALYVDGNLNASGDLAIQMDATATLDLFVAGTFNASNGLTLGSTSSPAHCRAYVAGATFNVSGSAALGCNVYAPEAQVSLANGSTTFGSLFGKSIQANGNAIVHYDTSIASASGECCSAGTCDDGNPCTVDACNGDGTCGHTAVANGARCTGTNKCDQVYTCQAGACLGSSPVTCAASDGCHIAGTCDPTSGACSNPDAPNGTNCNDGNACTQSDTCQSGACAGSDPITCAAEDTCHLAGTCNPATGACSNPAAANGTPCSDGNACTQTDTCQNGTCTGSNQVTCGAADACHVAGTCNPGTGSCSNPIAANGTMCSDGNACTQADSCQNGACVGSNPIPCTASDACHTAGTCDPSSGTCSNPGAPDGTPCDDGNACTQSDTCLGSACTGANPVTCTASDACHVAGTCDATTGQCSSPAAPDGTTCPSNNLCDTSFACAGGTCVGTNPVSCPPSDACHVAGACDAATGSCSSVPAPDGTPCTGNDPCLTNYVCQAGACNGSSPVVCRAQDACHTAGTCDPATGCSNPPIPGCDPAPVQGDNPFETQASIIGHVQTFGGGPVTGYTVTVYDVPVSVPRADATTQQASDGSFWTHLTSFPTSEAPRTPPHHLVVTIDTPGYLRATREVYAHPGTAVDLGVIDVVAADTNVVTIGPGGGSVTDSQGLITLIIPPGALATPTPITVTPIQNREEMPAPLPTITLTEYGFDLEPSGTQLAQPATLLITNWRNAPTAAPIPAGTYDAVNGGWKHVAMATWNGSAWTYPIQHFSVHDLNADDFGEWVMVAGKGQDPNGGAQICGGSSISVSGGSVNQDIPLPTYRHSGRDYGVTLNYSSGLAGSRTLGTAPSSSAQAIPTTGVGVSVRAQSYQKMCLPQNAAPSVVAGNPGSCGLGACNLGEESTVTPWTFNVDWMGLQQSQTVNYPANASSIDVATWVDLPLGQDGTTTTGSGFVTQQITAGLSLQGSGSSPSCATLGTFGSPNFGQITPSNLQPGPALDVQRQVLVYHRHNSPFGAGWALEEIPRLFTAPGSPDYVTLVRGDGSEEDFRPRARVTTQVPNAGDTDYVFASDPATGDNLMANDEGDIVRLNGDGTTTGVLSGLSFDGPVQSLAVTYIGGQRNYLVALTTRLLWVAPDGSAQSVYTRSGNTLGSYLPAQVAARNDLAVYTEGLLTQPILYRIRLSSPVGLPEAISSPQGSGDAGLDPTTTSVSGYSFYEPAGLAYAPTGELYVADSQRNAVMRVGLDMNGEIGPTSSIQHVVGDGAGRWVPDLGESFPGTQFPVNQPYFLSTSPDGTLLMASNYGVAALDPVSTQAEWIVFDQNTPGSDLSFRLFSIFSLFGSEYSNIAATGPRSFLAAPTASGTFPSLIDASLLGSDLDPTRTVTFSGVTATLVDATHALVENYDAQGRLTQRNLRTGEPLLSVAYADTASDRVSTVSDPDGGQTVFTYDPGTQKLSSMRDPAGRVTQFGRNSFGDLTSITEPDGEVLAFAYDGHHMTSKTARGSDTTTYVYRADGTLLSATKPAGETTTLTASLSSPAQYSTTGALIASGAYTDAHGVTHDFVTDPQGQIQTDDSTADGVAYARALVYDSQLDPLSTEFVPSTNANLLRVAYTTLNGVPLGLIVHHDTLGRVNQADGQVQGDHLYQYDSNGWLADVLVTPSDDDQRIVRDPAGHPLRIFDESAGVPSGREVDFTWGRIDGQPSAIVKHGVTYALSYDDSGGATRNLSGVVDTLGRTASFAFDASGNVAVASDGATTSSFAYDGNNRMLVAADALSNQTLFGYTQVNCGCSEADEVSSVHTPDLAAGAQWSLVYGAEGRLASVTDPDGHVESYGYEPTGELRALTDRDGNTTAVTHDQLGRVLTIVDALGRAHARAYPVPVQVNSVPPSASWVGPSLTSGSASGTAASADFTAALNAGDYQIGHNLYQPQGYPANVSFYRDATFQLSYIDQWDDARRPTRHRDRAGEPVSSTDITNATSSFLDETTGYSPFTSAPVVEDTDSPRPPNGADEGIFDHNVEFDLTDDTGYGASSSNDVTYTYGRDPGGRLTGVNRSWISIGAQFFTGPNQTYAYYPNGKLQTYTGPDGTKTLSYDTRGLLQRMTVALGSTAENWSFDYDPVGRSAHVVYPDAHVRAQQYDNEGRLSSRCYQYGSQQYCYTATYDGAGNPETMTDPYGGSDSFQYDALNRLTQVTHAVNGVTEHVENYGYNAIGAVKTTFDPGTMSAVTLDDERPTLAGGGTADAAVPNTLGGQPVTLDGGGRVTSLNGVTFTYDFRNRVTGTQSTSAGDTVTETYGYDSFLRRVQRQHTETNPASTTSEFYVFDGADLVATVDGTATLKDAYLFAGVDHPLRLSRGGSSYFYEVDLAGNVRRLRDASGEDLGGYRYTAFGAAFAADAQTPAAAVDQPLRWKGRWFEEAIAGGVYEVRARWWSPGMGGFLSTDDLNRHSSRTTLWGWPGSNPIRFRDPYGRGPEADAFFNAVAAGAEEGYDEGGGGGYALLGAAFGAGLAVLNAIVDPADPADDSGGAEVGDSAGGDCKAGGRGQTANGAPDLPGLDSTGKVHGELPKPQDLGKYSDEDLQQLKSDLEQSVQERIRTNDALGPDQYGAHGERQGDEQDLIQSIENELDDRGVSQLEGPP